MKSTMVAVAAAVALGMGGGLLAANASGPATVDGCYRDSTGALRIDTGSGCRPGETEITLGTGGGGGAGVSTRVVMASDTIGGTDGEFKGASALCDEGEVVTGGGMEIQWMNPEISIITNAPVTVGGLQGWQVTLGVDPSGSTSAPFFAIAICTPGTSTDWPTMPPPPE